MGSLGKDNDREVRDEKWNSVYAETQPLDSQISPPSSTGEAAKENVDWLHCLQTTVPFNDSVPPKYTYETEILNLAGETQILDVPQLMETQLIDDFDTQVVLDSDGEGTDRTEIVDDTEELSEDDSLRKYTDQLAVDLQNIRCSSSEEAEKRDLKHNDQLGVDRKNMRCDSDKEEEKGDPKQQDFSGNEKHISRSVQGGFTSIRAASLRASGIAARNKGMSSGSRSALSNSHSLEQHSVERQEMPFGRDLAKLGEEIDQEHGMETVDERILKDEDNHMAGRATVRRLFAEDLALEDEGLSNRDDADEGEDGCENLACDELAGLSYVDSQEPGELTQANALEFVDKFLQDNMDSDEEIDHAKSITGKSTSFLTAKGPQSLAKKASNRSTIRGKGVYDWDDNHEDEGGGDIFRRRKDDFLDIGNGRKASMTEPRKPKKDNSYEPLVKDRGLNLHKKISGLVYSDSKLLHHREEPSSIETDQVNLKRSLIDELNEQSDVNSLEGQMKPSVATIDDPQIPDVGPDTQLAAEAMEALCNAEVCANADDNNAYDIIQSKSENLKETYDRGPIMNKVKRSALLQKTVSHDKGVLTRQARRNMITDVKLSNQSSISSGRHSKNVRKGYDTELRTEKLKKAKLNSGDKFISGNLNKMSSKLSRIKSGGLELKDSHDLDTQHDSARSTNDNLGKKLQLDEMVGCSTPVAHCTRKSISLKQWQSSQKGHSSCRRGSKQNKDFDLPKDNLKSSKTKSGGPELKDIHDLDTQNDCAWSVNNSFSKKQQLDEIVYCSTPIAHRTRRSISVKQLQSSERGHSLCRRGSKQNKDSDLPQGKRRTTTELASEVSRSVRESTKSVSPQAGGHEFSKQGLREELDPVLTQGVNGLGSETLRHPRRRRSSSLGQVSKCNGLSSSSEPCLAQENRGLSGAMQRKLECNGGSAFLNARVKRRRSSAHIPPMPSRDNSMEGLPSLQSLDKSVSTDSANNSKNGKMLSLNANELSESGNTDQKSDADAVPSGLDQSPRQMCKPAGPMCTPPAYCTTPVNEASPVCMGNEYLKQSCKKSLSRPCLLKELSRLTDTGMEPSSALQYSRKRRDINDVRVLYSHHLDEDIVKQQKKILARLGVSIASSIADATHFIADKFIRTRNMLEAIASGKPVVTHLWIDSCGQASCFIDEKNYILRDAKKERELGFNMLVSLQRAQQHPMLLGQRVLITPNTKPGKEIISSLVKAGHGQPLERVGRSALKDERIPDDLLILSCEEDYGICLPFLEKGAAVYSSELLLNGIVIQRLEYERHRLFADNVKRTRSTIWLRKASNKFVPVVRNK